MAQIPLILRFHRLMDAFAKSDDERDFYLDRKEGFLIFADLDKGAEDLALLEKELSQNASRYAIVPKMTFFEIKKFMEGFIQEKVYDIDTKEKLLEIISGKEARENFLEFIYDQLTELEKWQLYYQERSRVRIIEWLRSLNISFVFEEDLDFSRAAVEKLKKTLFDHKVLKDIESSRDLLLQKSKIYYSSEALNPRPKRGRPPKQTQKVVLEPQFTLDIYMTVPSCARPFLFIPDISSASAVTFSARFESEEHLLASLRGTTRIKVDEKLEALSERLESLQKLTTRLSAIEPSLPIPKLKPFVEKKEITARPIEKEERVEKIVKEIRKGKPAKELAEGEFLPQKRKGFGIKQVAPIKSKKKKGK